MPHNAWVWVWLPCRTTHHLTPTYKDIRGQAKQINREWVNWFQLVQGLPFSLKCHSRLNKKIWRQNNIERYLETLVYNEAENVSSKVTRWRPWKAKMNTSNLQGGAYQSIFIISLVDRLMLSHTLLGAQPGQSQMWGRHPEWKGQLLKLISLFVSV